MVDTSKMQEVGAIYAFQDKDGRPSDLLEPNNVGENLIYSYSTTDGLQVYEHNKKGFVVPGSASEIIPQPEPPLTPFERFENDVFVSLSAKKDVLYSLLDIKAKLHRDWSAMNYNRRVQYFAAYALDQQVYNIELGLHRRSKVLYDLLRLEHPKIPEKPYKHADLKDAKQPQQCVSDDKQITILPSVDKAKLNSQAKDPIAKIPLGDKLKAPSLDKPTLDIKPKIENKLPFHEPVKSTLNNKPEIENKLPLHEQVKSSLNKIFNGKQEQKTALDDGSTSCENYSFEVLVKCHEDTRKTELENETKQNFQDKPTPIWEITLKLDEPEKTLLSNAELQQKWSSVYGLKPIWLPDGKMILKSATDDDSTKKSDADVMPPPSVPIVAVDELTDESTSDDSLSTVLTLKGKLDSISSDSSDSLSSTMTLEGLFDSLSSVSSDSEPSVQLVRPSVSKPQKPTEQPLAAAALEKNIVETISKNVLENKKFDMAYQNWCKENNEKDVKKMEVAAMSRKKAVKQPILKIEKCTKKSKKYDKRDVEDKVQPTKEERNEIIKNFLRIKIVKALCHVPLPTHPVGPTMENVDSYLSELHKMYVRCGPDGPPCLREAKAVLQKLALQKFKI